MAGSLDLAECHNCNIVGYVYNLNVTVTTDTQANVKKSPKREKKKNRKEKKLNKREIKTGKTKKTSYTKISNF